MMVSTDGYPPGSGPPARRLTDDELVRIVAGGGQGTLAVNTPDGYPHLSNMLYHWDADQRTIRMSTTADRIKTRHLRRDPRSALHVPASGFFSFAVAQGEAELSDVSTVPGDEAGLELLRSYAFPVEAGDEEAFLKQMVADRRLVIRLRVSRLYGITFDAAE